MDNSYGDCYLRKQIEDWTNHDIYSELRQRDERIDELEERLDSLAGALFKFASKFAEEINI